MRLTRSQIAIVIGAVALIILGALVFLGVIPGLRSTSDETLKGELVIWGVDDQAAFNEAFVTPYNDLNPEVSISYRQFSEDSYESALINALASGRGPDIFMVKNSWIPEHGDKLLPLTEQDYPLANLKNDFVDVVSADFHQGGLTYALPLYVDSLTLFYNKDIFNNAGIINPPKTWTELDAIIPALRRLNPAGRFVQVAAALGGSKTNINRASDLLSLFMLQDRVEMVSEDKSRASFALSGEVSFRRYLQYANPISESYTWNDELRSADDEFANEDLAIIFDYSGKQRFFKEKNPFLNFALAPMPQKDAASAINYASYWGLGVAKTSLNSGLAWNFIGSSLLSEASVQRYTQTTQRPPALRQLLARLGADAQKGFLVKQTLTARSWYQVDEDLVQISFSDAIAKVLNAQSTPEAALAEAEATITEELERSSSPSL
ncbi:MAG: extracellular solute-binding protein [Candidatus Harrisonbacteria bacterium]|nr:extracellular solute-binding protein [Candidatus Harrisonbacteria bacterium]